MQWSLFFLRDHPGEVGEVLLGDVCVDIEEQLSEQGGYEEQEACNESDGEGEGEELCEVESGASGPEYCCDDQCDGGDLYAYYDQFQEDGACDLDGESSGAVVGIEPYEFARCCEQPWDPGVDQSFFHCAQCAGWCEDHVKHCTEGFVEAGCWGICCGGLHEFRAGWRGCRLLSCGELSHPPLFGGAVVLGGGWLELSQRRSAITGACAECEESTAAVDKRVWADTDAEQFHGGLDGLDDCFDNDWWETSSSCVLACHIGQLSDVIYGAGGVEWE